MADMSHVQALYPRTKLQFLRETPVKHSHRILLRNGGACVESPMEFLVVYPAGIVTFTVHSVESPGGRTHNVFADANGWAFDDLQINNMIRTNIILPVAE